MLKIVVHVVDMAKWEGALINVHNALVARPEAVVELVCDGEAVKFVAKDYQRPAMFDELVKKGVVFAACRNALAYFNVAEKDLAEGVVAVIAGIIEVTEKQAEGYGYIKP